MIPFSSKLCLNEQKLEQAKTERLVYLKQSVTGFEERSDFWKDDIRSVGLFLSEQEL